jgi:hypothetical protein
MKSVSWNKRIKNTIFETSITADARESYHLRCLYPHFPADLFMRPRARDRVEAGGACMERVFMIFGRSPFFHRYFLRIFLTLMIFGGPCGLHAFTEAGDSKPVTPFCEEGAWQKFEEFCKTRQCRKDMLVKIKKKDGSYFVSTQKLAPPAVEPRSISILPGETLFVEADIDSDLLVNLKQVTAVTHPEKTIRLEFWQEPTIRDGTEMLLKVSNPFEKHLRYKLYMMTTDSDSMRYTSSCPVMPGKFSLEHWPYPLFQIFVVDIKLVTPGVEKLVCE